jgi:hypothetical protein
MAEIAKEVAFTLVCRSRRIRVVVVPPTAVPLCAARATRARARRRRVYKRLMEICEIIAVKHKDSFRWIWRHVSPEGDVDESKESYPLFYECLSAAREKGYQPRFKSS